MRIQEAIQSNIVSVSCEIFPPKVFRHLEDVRRVAEATCRLDPAFVSVTYRANGTAHTVDIAQSVYDAGCEPLVHLTCVNNTPESVDAVLDELEKRNIRNVLALRGDLPEGVTEPGYFAHADDLIRYIRRRSGFTIGAACYPEGHPESPNRDADLDNLKRKVDAGADFLTTQMFFDNNILYNFLFRALKKGIDIPILAGIMPVINGKQIARSCKLSGTALPPRFAGIVDRFSDDPACMQQAGIAFATEQIIDLIANGVNHIHLYTMNRPDVAKAIFGNLSNIIGRHA